MADINPPPAGSPDQIDFSAARRRIQERLDIESSAYSLDGRTFSYEAPLPASLPPGDIVEIRACDGRSYLGQVLGAGVTERAGPAVQVGGDGGLDTGLKDIAIANVTYTVRLRHVTGEGQVLGRIDGDRVERTGAHDTFDHASIAAASGERIAGYLECLHRGTPTLNIGTLAGFDNPPPASLLASGFGRHTFLVGQSGSGKTYSLGVMLERLLLDTSLRMVIVDPNSDYVRLGDPREDVATHSPERAERYRRVASKVRVLRPANRTNDPRAPLRIHFSDLEPRVQALVMQIDPIQDRDEYDAYRSILRQLGSDRYSLKDIQAAARNDLSSGSRQVAMRIAALGIGEWAIWAERGDPSVFDLAGRDGDWRALVLDVGGFEQAEEKSLVANALFGQLWRRRDEREPCLVVIDEAHNICPQEPSEPIQAMATRRAVTIAAEGRKYGLYLLLSTQRPSKIHVNAQSQCDNLVLMRMNSTEDLHHLSSVFSFVPESLLARSTGFAQGESLVSGKISPVPVVVRFGHRFSHEGGSDVPDTWTRAGD